MIAPMLLALCTGTAAFVPSQSFLGVRPRLAPLALSTADFKNGLVIDFDGIAF
jgi:hypothetical protein